LPGLVVVGRLSGEYCLVQWAVPIDAGTTRCFNINNWRRLGRWREIVDRVHLLSLARLDARSDFLRPGQGDGRGARAGVRTTLEDRCGRHRLAPVRGCPCATAVRGGIFLAEDMAPASDEYRANGYQLNDR